MDRRQFILTASAGVALCPSASLAAQPISIRGLWAEGPFPTTKPNQVRGILHFYVNSSSWEQRLKSYSNDRLPNDPVVGVRECVELIQRYAAYLGSSYWKTSAIDRDDRLAAPLIGSGMDTAKNFWKSAGLGFQYFENGQKILPKVGSVISVQGWPASKPGHTGILCNYTPPFPSQDRITIKIFDQNTITVLNDIQFVKINGLWWGTYKTNSASSPLVGWASPPG